MLETIGNHIWQSTLFAVLIAGLCWLLRRDGARVRYWLWWTASIKFLVPFAWLMALGALFAGDSVPIAGAAQQRVVRIMQYEGASMLGAGKKLMLGAAGSLTITSLLIAGCQTQRTALTVSELCRDPSNMPEMPEYTFADFENGVFREGAHLPMVKVAPVYPPDAASQRLEGHVIVDYTVAADGSTQDVRVIESSSALFERSAQESASQYRYKPCVIDGQPVAVAGVRTRIEYVLVDSGEQGSGGSIRRSEPAGSVVN